MLAAASLLMAAGQAALDEEGGGGGGGEGPSAAPSSVSLYSYGGSNVGVQWTNGDVTAATQLGTSSNPSTEPTTVAGIVAAGATNYETGTSGTIGFPATGTYWWVRHFKNSQASAWVCSSQGVS